MLAASSASANSLDESIASIQKVGPEGEGSVAASTAWKQLCDMDASAIVPLLTSMDQSGPLAKNWIRSALEVIFQRTAANTPENLPLESLENFLSDTGQSARARKLAFDLIQSVDEDKAAQLQPGFLNDPSPELRLGAVELLITEGKTLLAKGKTEEAGTTLKSALDSARDINQIKQISKLLRDKVGMELDLPGHFGFLMHWHVAGPFDNTKRSGFAAVFEPEKGPVDLSATYHGKSREVAWKPYSTTDEYGMVDFNQPYDPLKEVTAYAYTEFESDKEQQVELRLGCKNAWKIWLNGEFIFGRDEYHRGMRIDQYQLPVTLQKGTNTILVKACQDEQTQTWTKEWQFQIRVCDSTGTAVLSTNRKPTPTTDTDRRTSAQ